MTHVLIAVPTHSAVSADFAFCLQALVYRCALSNITITVQFEVGTVLSSLREKLASYTLSGEYTHVMWLDSDMGFPDDVIMRLLGHNVPVIACSYSTRTPPIRSTAYVGDSEIGFDPLSTECEGIVPVVSVGMGCMLVQSSVFNKLDRPWFPITYHTTDGGVNYYQGEDVNFCLQLRQKNISVLIDTDLSREIYHIGQAKYGWQ